MLMSKIKLGITKKEKKIERMTREKEELINTIAFHMLMYPSRVE